MAYKDFKEFSLDSQAQPQTQTLQIEGTSVELPDASYIRDAAYKRDGADLVLDGPQGTITVEGYYTAAETPNLVAPDGQTLSPELVNSFTTSAPQYAQSASMNDASAVGAVDEVSGDATITRLDGSVSPITIGTPVYEGDIIETSADGAVNIAFNDETTFAVSQEARLAIDEYVYDPVTESGTQDFSVLKGVFVFTSGLIGRDDPDDVNIDTPSGSIGIRGTIIAGDVDTGEITVVEGAIVVRDLSGNEMTLATQFDTAKLKPAGGGIEHMGELPAQEVAQKFAGVSNVSPTLFSSINDAAAEQGEAPQPVEGPKDVTPENFDTDGSVDQNNDNQVDGTLEETPAEAPAENLDAPQTDEEAALETKTEEILEPKPVLNNTMMGTDTMGTQSMMGQPGTTTSGTDGTTTTMMMSADPVIDMGGENTMDNAETVREPVEQGREQPPQDPGSITSPPPEPTGNAPWVISDHPQIVPQANFAQNQVGVKNFFQASDDQSWSHDFSLEFYDPDTPFNNDTLTFDLSGSTETALNARFGSNWNFNNGELVITETGAVSTDTFQITVIAKDPEGNEVEGQFDFELYSGTTVNPTTQTGIGLTLTGTTAGGGVDTVQIGDFGGTSSSSSKFFFGGGDDVITLDASTGNTIFLGEGNNDITILNNSLTTNKNNNIFGDNGNDKFILEKGDNKIFGMGGDDIFKLDNSKGNSYETILNDGVSFLDGGSSDFKAADTLKTINGLDYKFGNEGTGGYGDTLKFQGSTGTLDFTIIDQNRIRGIERLDTKGAGTQVVTLTYQDIIDMTDYKNTLIIRADNSDFITFAGDFSNVEKVPGTGDDVSIDDDYDNSDPSTSFDIYTNGEITLLIEQDGGGNSVMNVVGL